MSGAKLFGISRNGHEPREERSIFDKGLPLGNIPAHVLRRGGRSARLAAEKYNDRVGLRRDKSKQENVLCTTVVAFEDGITEGRTGVKLNLLMPGAYKMIYNVG